MLRRTIAVAALVSIAACGDRITPPSSTMRAANATRDVTASPCAFAVAGTTMTLTASCTTDASVVVPDGFTLDGNGYTITAVDPAGGHFTGGVVTNGGSSANVRNVTVTASGLADVCDGGAARLRGIIFVQAAGSISHNTVTGINQGASGCQEGNAIEVRNFGDANVYSVDIAHNTITDYQKTGIVCNGSVTCAVHENTIGASATQANLAANSVQFGFGSTGSLDNNDIAGNTWFGTSNDDATAVLIFQSNGVHIGSNKIDGNSDIGIYAFADNLVIEKNFISDAGIDPHDDIGIGNYGDGNLVTKNQVSGFSTPYDGPVGAKNRVRKPLPTD